MKTKILEIETSNGEELFQVSKLVQTAVHYKSTILLEIEQTQVNAKSFMGMCILAKMQGNAIRVTADGPDEAQAVQEMYDLLEQSARARRSLA